MALGSNIQYKASVLFQAAYDKESAKDYENRLVDLSKNAAEMSKKEFAKAFKGLGNIINEALRTLKMPEIDVSNILKTNTNIDAFGKLGETFGDSFNEGIEIALTNNGNINKLLEIKIRKLESNKLYKAQRRISAVKHLSKAEGVYDLGSGSVRFTDFSNKTTEDVAKEMDSLYEGIDNLLSGLKSINQKTNPDKYHEQLRSLQDRIADYIEGIGGLQKIPSLSGNSKYTVEALRQLTGKHGFGMEFWSDHVARAQKDMGKYRGTDEYIQMTKLEDSIRTLEAQAQYASKSVRDITQAIGEMSSLSRPEQKKKVKGVEQVITDVENGKVGQVGRAFNQYKDAKDAGSDWVTMYSKALKFLTAFNAMDPEKQLTAERDWRILAERLNPMFDQIKSSLELFVQTANARLYPASGGGDGTGGGTGGGGGSGSGTGTGGSGGVGEHLITEEEMRQAEENYDKLSARLNQLGNEASEASAELEKLEKRALIYGFGADKTPAQEGRIQQILSKNNRNKYVVDMLQNGYQPIATNSGEYGFDRPDLGKNVFNKITKTEYEYAQYLSQKIKEMNVGWDEGLKILQSQNGQLEAARAKVNSVNTEYEKTRKESEAAYEEQARVHSIWNRQQAVGSSSNGSSASGDEQPEQTNSAPTIEEENNALREQISLIKQIAAAYEHKADVEVDQPDNDAAIEKATDAVEVFTEKYYSALITMQDGSKINIPLGEDFAEITEQILEDASKIQNIDLVPKSAEAAAQAYQQIQFMQHNIRNGFGRSWGKATDGKSADALLYLNKTRASLEDLISRMNQADPDGKLDLSGAKQTAVELLSTIEEMQPKFAMMLQTETKLKEMNIAPDAELYYDVVKGIKDNTLTTVDQCIAKYKELAGIVDVVDDKTDTTPETGRGAGDESGSGGSGSGSGSGSGDGGGGGPNDGELQNLEAIESVVGRIKTAVGEKSKAFLEEQVIVERVAQSEVHSLGEVEKKVNAVRVALERICGGKISSGMMTINIKTSGNGSGKKPGTAKSGMDDEIFDAKIATQFSKLFLMTEQLRASGKLTDTVRDKLDLLWDDLNNVSDAKSLTLWREEFTQINNEIKEIALANKSVEDVDVDPFNAALENAKLYNKFVLKMHGTNDAELKNKYETMANDLLVEQTQLLNGIVLTKEQEKQLDDLKNQRELDILELQKKQELQAKKAADAKAKNEIIEANKKLGQLQAQQEQAPKEIQGSFDYLINQQKQIIEDKSKLLSIDKELYDADRVKAYNEAIGRLKIEDAKANHREDISESNRTFRRQVANSRTNAQLSRSRSTVFAGQEIISNLDKIKNAVGVTEASKAKINELRGALDDLKQTYNTLNNQAEPISKEDADKVISQTNNVRLLNAEMKKLLEQHQKLSGDNVDVIGVYSPKMTRKDIEDQTLEWYKKMHQQNPDEYKGINIKGFDDNGNLIASLKSGEKEFTNISVAVDKLSGNIAVVRGQVKKTLGPVDLIIDKTKQLGYYLTGSFLINFARQQVQKGIQYVREIDSALTDLKKVTDETEETYEKFLDTASKTADKVGSTIKEIVSSTADWSRLGYSLEDAAKLAETTSVLLNVSEFSSIDEATGALTSTLQAFGYTADNAMGVVDVMNEIGNNFAISSDGIATALQDSASSLMAANNSYEEAVALIAAANRVVNLCHVVIVI
jgi:uncharacterized membrane protein YgcG